MSRVLVTGGAGFVGSHLVEQLASTGEEIVVLDSLLTGKTAHLPSEAKNIRLEQGDIRDSNLLDKIFREFRPTTVFHLAAIHYIPLCEANPREAVSVNVEGTVALLEACQAFIPERLVVASTAAVYGPGETAHSEAEIPAPMDIYGITKLAGEMLVKLFHQRTGVPTVAARLFNVIGPNETNPHLIPEIINQLRGGGTQIEIGNLEPRRDYVHARDVAHALVQLARLEKVSFDIFNVGTGKAYSVKEVLDILSSIWPSPFQIVQVPNRVRPVDRKNLAADILHIRETTGWTPTIDLETCLRQLALD